MKLPGTKVYVPLFLVSRKQVSFSLYDLPCVLKNRFQQLLIRERRGRAD